MMDGAPLKGIVIGSVISTMLWLLIIGLIIVV